MYYLYFNRDRYRTITEITECIRHLLYYHVYNTLRVTDFTLYMFDSRKDAGNEVPFMRTSLTNRA